MTTNSIKKIAAVSALIFMGACDMYHETYMTPNRIQIEERQFEDTRKVSEASDAYLDAIANNYTAKGVGAVDLTVSYDPFTGKRSADNASAAANKIAERLEERGLRGARVSIKPVTGMGSASDVTIAYTAVNALPPKDCALMDGIESTTSEPDPTYKLGCSVDTFLVEQVARPKDLAGRVSDDTTSDGRRAANMVEMYRGGMGNKPLEGEKATK